MFTYETCIIKFVHSFKTSATKTTETIIIISLSTGNNIGKYIIHMYISIVIIVLQCCRQRHNCCRCRHKRRCSQKSSSLPPCTCLLRDWRKHLFRRGVGGVGWRYFKREVSTYLSKLISIANLRLSSVSHQYHLHQMRKLYIGPKWLTLEFEYNVHLLIIGLTIVRRRV